jgi:hypothetical protein
MRDPDAPTVFPEAIDLERNDGVTAYAHDVQVDAGHRVGVGTRRRAGLPHARRALDPVEGVRRIATPWDPVPYAGGKFTEETAPSSFMHNPIRTVGSTLPDGADPRHGYRPDQLIIATEEAFGDPTCDGIGMFSIASLQGSYDGQGWASTPDAPFRLETVGTWTPHEQAGVLEGSFCSADYFEVSDSIVAYAWYVQGTRFLDISDPTNPIQIAYYRPDATLAWAPYFHGDHIYVADHVRGVDILRLTTGARGAQQRRAEVVAPAMSEAALANAEALTARFAPDPQLGWACLIPRD